MSIVFALERTNQLSLLPDKDLVDLCPPIEPYQVTKNRISLVFSSVMIDDIALSPLFKVGWCVTLILTHLNEIGDRT
ncbi:MAG: hypothetical protein PX481_15085 [Microcystis sp. M53603_WE2]|uniref:hypothetical protein n=1 Tax=Microcystis sp. M53603_WE2 TaxID=3030678 RepID=UPI002588D456|nr:hypothetical protein [Microcystis sp. M53603_WE2]MDJ0539974.1 hypothetical protein [Microcystis sp. M53603_WE2]